MSAAPAPVIHEPAPSSAPGDVNVTRIRRITNAEKTIQGLQGELASVTYELKLANKIIAGRAREMKLIRLVVALIAVFWLGRHTK